MSTCRTLQQRIAAFDDADVYPVISSEFCLERDPAAVLELILEGGAKVVQMREKNMDDGCFLALLKKSRILTDRFGALLIVDDRIDLALACGADGVHLGQSDMPLADAKKIAPELLYGVSTHNESELAKAQQDGCGYLNIGPVFATGTKVLPMEPVGIEMLRRLSAEVKCPFSVMGGIKFEHLGILKSLGVRHIAAVTAFTAADDPAAEVRRWRISLSGC